MIIKEIKYKPFKVEFTRPFNTSIGVISERTGFYLSLKDELGNSGIGEISPLPGFSKECFNDIEKELPRLNNILYGKEFEINSISEFQLLYDQILLPSVQFGFEQALINLLLLRNHQKFSFFNDIIIKNMIEVNAIIDIIEKEEVLKKVVDFIASGFKTIKIKIGRKNFNDDLQIIDLIRNKIPDEVQIRLDSNGAWDADTTFENIQRLSSYNIQYIEDPCNKIDCLIKLSSFSPIPIALDTNVFSLQDLSNYITNNSFNFLVVKPMLLGSIFKLIDLINKANKIGVNLIISSTFETPVGRSIHCFLAALTTHKYAHGLATSHYFTDKKVHDSFPIKNGSIIFQKNLFPPKFDISL